MAAALAADGVAPGAVVAWQLPTWIEAFVLAGALAVLDATQVPLLPIYRDREIEHAVRTTGASLVGRPRVVRDGRPGRPGPPGGGRALGGRPPGVRVLVVGERHAALGTRRSRALGSPEVDVDGDPVRWVFHTSGTTADPKGVRHTDGTMLAAARAFAHSVHLTSADRNAVPFPVTHIGGIQLLVASLEVGCANILLDRFVAADAVPLLAREGVTLAGAGPAFFHGYLEEQARQPDVPIFPPGAGVHERRRAQEPGAARRARGRLRRRARFELRADGVPEHHRQRPRHARRGARPHRGPGQPGRRAVGAGARRDGRRARATRASCGSAGPQLFRGYVDRSLDAAAFDADGFFRTGDLVRVDDGGHLHVVGRIKDVIIRKGENISAHEVEDALAEHPAVGRSPSSACPTPPAGERACAVVVPTDPAAPPSLDDADGLPPPSAG